MMNDLYAYIEGQAKQNHMNQEDLGQKLGYSQSAYSKRLKNQTLTILDLITLFEIFDVEPNKIVNLLKVKK